MVNDVASGEKYTVWVEKEVINQTGLRDLL